MQENTYNVARVKTLSIEANHLLKLRVFMEECAFVKGWMAAGKKPAICPSKS